MPLQSPFFVSIHQESNPDPNIEADSQFLSEASRKSCITDIVI